MAMEGKQKLIETLIQKKEEELDGLRRVLDNTIRDVVDAPGSSESHSDTMKFQHSNLALGIGKRISEAEESLRALKSIPHVSFDKIFTGSFFAVRTEENGGVNYYLLIPQGGGQYFEIEEKEIMAISEKAPLAQTLWGKKKGDIIRFRNKTLKVVDVQ